MLSFLAFSAANAADWLFVDDTEKGNRFYVDIATLAEQDGYKLAWIKVEIAETDSDVGRYVQLWKLDCKSTRLAVPSYTIYARDGEVLESDDTAYSSWKNIRPDTVTEYISELICSGEWQAIANQALEDAARATEAAANQAAESHTRGFAAEAGEAVEQLNSTPKIDQQ